MLHAPVFGNNFNCDLSWRRFDSPYRVSYWCSIGTKSLSPSVSEIFGSKVPVQCKSSLRMRDITWPVPLCKIFVHIWISHPHITYSLWHFYWAPMKIKGCLLVRPPMLNAKSSENFLSPDQNWALFGGFGGLGVRGFKKFRFLLQKAHVFVNPLVWAILRQNRSRGVTSRSVGGKTQKVTEAPIGKTCRR